MYAGSTLKENQNIDPRGEHRPMKTLLRVLMSGLLLLLTQVYAQEPKRAVAPHETIAEAGVSRDQTIATGSQPRPAPAVQPKALPELSPSLGEIARRARAAHAAAPKAQVVVADDAPAQK
jgi:hypothetical protein